MIEKLLSNPYLLHQVGNKVGDLEEIPEPPLAIAVDAIGLICISQEGRSIVIHRESVAELCKLLKLLKEGTP